jgi:hypothetical protein
MYTPPSYICLEQYSRKAQKSEHLVYAVIDEVAKNSNPEAKRTLFMLIHAEMGYD